MTKRLVLAYITAPIVPSLLDGISRVVGGSVNADQPFEMTNLLSPMLLIISYICASLIGIPAYLLLRRRLGSTWWKYLLCGSAIGCTPALLLAVTVSDGVGLGSGITSVAAAIGLIYGGIGGLAFWLIGITGRTSRITPNKRMQPDAEKLRDPCCG